MMQIATVKSLHKNAQKQTFRALAPGLLTFGTSALLVLFIYFLFWFILSISPSSIIITWQVRYFNQFHQSALTFNHKLATQIATSHFSIPIIQRDFTPISLFQFVSLIINCIQLNIEF